MMQMPDATENQFLGALLGMAIGDALGAPVSGMDQAEITALFGAIDRFHGNAQPDSDEIHPGEFTDETELALCIVESDRKSTRLNSSHTVISYAVFCLKKKKRK